MVCRENKGRSAMIGLAKSFQRMMGHPVDHDANLQSMQHQLRHEVEAADEKFSNFDSWPKDEQIKAWTELRARVEELPEGVMSDARRYGESKTNPGVITRIDQEIARLRSGKHENGSALKSVQQNTGADMVASMKIVSVMERLVPARRNFIENQARRRGVPYAEAEAEWLSKINEKGNFSNISLTDDYRDSLQISGVSAQDQADLGQAGRARYAMAAMEEKTQTMLAAHRKANPPRPAIDDSHRLGTYTLPPGDGAIRCAACGQFGHEKKACPNTDLTDTLDAVSERSQILDKHQSILDRREMLASRSEEEIQAVFDAKAPGMTVAKFRAALERDEKNLGEPLMGAAAVQKMRRKCEKEGQAALAELKAREPKVSNWVESVSYNPNNGLLRVTMHPAKSGKTYPPRYFRARPEEVDELMEHPSIGKALHAGFLSKNKTVEGHEFENAADLAEALQETRCPTCGRWASLNSSHRCPVIGGPSEEVDQVRTRNVLTYQAMARQARENGEPVPMKPPTIFQSLKGTTDNSHYVVDPQTKQKVAGALRSGDKQEAMTVTEDGSRVWDTAVTFNGSNDDWHVSGHVAVWKDPETGGRLIGIDGQSGNAGLQCQCPAYQKNRRCPHVVAVGRRLAAKYEAQPAYRATRAGEPLRLQQEGLANDAASLPPERLSYSTMSAMRVGAMRDVLDAADTHGIARLPETLWPSRATDVATGEPIDPPTEWKRDPAQNPKASKAVDLANTGQVVNRIRRLSQSKTQLIPTVEPVPGGGFRTVMKKERVQYSVRAEPDGSIVLNLPPSILKDGGNTARARAMESHLRSTMGLPAGQRVIPHGIRISSDPSARYAALDAIAGDPARIAPTRMYAPQDGSFAAALHRGRAGNAGQFAPA
ncbi:hypothetical protein [Dietzia sp. 179-F 9C3 NHS]|uniref:hypothetical protein n=1 Tax=Dietzia sp. 179-F 9C3 NHS TaxID=3374295 RepID=UPI003878F562